MKTRLGPQACLLGVCFVVGCVLTARTMAAPPWQKLIPFKSVDADPKKSYWLTEDNGPWMIFATSFAGEGAEAQARELVLELRKRYKMEAYMHKRHFDFTEPVYGRGVNRYGEPKKMRYHNATSFDEIAVLVGNYTSLDAPGADEDLEVIKTAKPHCLDLAGAEGKKKTAQRFVVLRELQRLAHLDPEMQKAGPMRRAFIARNPILPKEYFVGSGLDPFVLNMNKGVRFGLLDCPGRYTVRVASFRGETHFLGEGADEESKSHGSLLGFPGHGKTSKLEVAADNAHRLTEMLRKKGIEAYEFHDRCESIVTVGSFETVGHPLPNGRIDLLPAIHQIMVTYGAERSPLPNHGQGMRPKSLDGIPFDVQPLPVVVPRRSISSDYAVGDHSAP